MSSSHADKKAKGHAYMGAYVPRDLAARVERVVLSNGRSAFLRRAIEREVARIEGKAVQVETDVAIAVGETSELPHVGWDRMMGHGD